MEDPVKIGNELYENYLKYISTNIRLKGTYQQERDDLYRNPHGSGSLMQSPVIEFGTTYKPCKTIDDIYGKDSIMAKFLHNGMFAFGSYPLYEHQVKSIESARDKNVIVTTGTGSGKTESFLIPVTETLVNEASTEWENGKQQAIRTLIMYPLNALAEDQLVRMRKTFDTEEVRNLYKTWGAPITFGRYTGQTQKKLSDAKAPYECVWKSDKYKNDEDLQWMFPKPQNAEKEDKSNLVELMSRDIMLGEKNEGDEPSNFVLPDILITNYSMLSVILMRKQESHFFEETKKWLENKNHVFTIVIDELHSYRGTAGTEVAYILRNLISRLGLDENSPQLRFIATSASLGDDSPDATYNRYKFISEFFRNESLNKENYEAQKKIIDGKFTIINDPPVDEEVIKEKNNTLLPDKAISELMELSKKRDNNSLTETESKDFLKKYNIINVVKTATLRETEKSMQAISVADLKVKLFGDKANEDKEDSLIGTLLLLINKAKKDEKMALQPMRAHYFFKNIPGLWVCINPACSCKTEEQKKDKSHKWGKLYAEPIQRCKCGSKVLEVVFCRKCGEVFPAGYKKPDSDIELQCEKPSTNLNDRLRVVYRDDKDFSKNIQYPESKPKVGNQLTRWARINSIDKDAFCQTVQTRSPYLISCFGKNR